MLFFFNFNCSTYSSLNAHEELQKLQKQSSILWPVGVAQMPLVHALGSALIISSLGTFRGIHKLESMKMCVCALCVKTCMFYIYPLLYSDDCFL